MGAGDYRVNRVTRVGEAATVHLVRRTDLARFRVIVLPRVRIDGVHRFLLDAYSGEHLAVTVPPWEAAHAGLSAAAREAVADYVPTGAAAHD